MKIIDLTHTISPEMPVYPGTEPPTLTTECTIDIHQIEPYQDLIAKNEFLLLYTGWSPLPCFPLNIKDADGSPIRAVAIIE